VIPTKGYMYMLLHKRFPPDIAARRRALLPVLTTAKRESKPASLQRMTTWAPPAPEPDTGLHGTTHLRYTTLCPFKILLNMNTFVYVDYPLVGTIYRC